jgi:hypothetical protein
MKHWSNLGMEKEMYQKKLFKHQICHSQSSCNILPPTTPSASDRGLPFFIGKEWNPTPWSNVMHLFIAWHCRLDCSIYYWMSSNWGTQLLQTLVV